MNLLGEGSQAICFPIYPREINDARDDPGSHHGITKPGSTKDPDRCTKPHPIKRTGWRHVETGVVNMLLLERRR